MIHCGWSSLNWEPPASSKWMLLDQPCNVEIGLSKAVAKQKLVTQLSFWKMEGTYCPAISCVFCGMYYQFFLMRWSYVREGIRTKILTVTLALERWLSGDRPEMSFSRPVVMRARKAKVAKSKLSTRRIWSRSGKLEIQTGDPVSYF